MQKASKVQLKKARELLREKRSRDENGLFVAEGLKIVSDIVAKAHPLDSVIVSRGFVKADENGSFLADLEKNSIPVFETGDTDFERISSLQHSQGVLAIIKKPSFSKKTPTADEAALLVLCDGVQDPGNLGTIIRTSVAFGVDAILLAGEAADIYNPKVVRASSGMMIDIPVYRCDAPELDRLKKEGYSFFVSQIRGEKGKDITGIKGLSGPSILAFGSEGKGVSGEIMERADEFFYIPIGGKAESLNVTAAAAIALYVFARTKGD
ncbi:MAG: RNA methyltransferase [Candidatus Omnitrophota bacterium]